MALDDTLAAKPATSGAIQRSSAPTLWLSTQPHLRRQDLEALERDEQIAVFLKPDEAVASSDPTTAPSPPSHTAG